MKRLFGFKIGDICLGITIILILILIGPYTKEMAMVSSELNLPDGSNITNTVSGISETNAILVFLITIFATLTVCLKMWETHVKR